MDELVDHDAQTSAGPTQLSPLSGEALAYSQDAEPVEPTLDQPRRDWLTPSRITVAAVVTSLAAVVATVGYAGYTIGHHPAPPVATISSTAPPAAPKVAALDGLYRLDYDGSKQTRTGTAAPVENNTTFWTFRTQCHDGECVATAVGMEKERPTVPRAPRVDATLRYIGGNWVQDPFKDKVPQPSCLEDGRVRPGHDLEQSQWVLEAQGELFRGSQKFVVLTNECGLQGATLDVPVTASRIGPRPDGVTFPDDPGPPPTAPRLVPGADGPNGVYKVLFMYSGQTVNGKLVDIPEPNSVELWAFKSACTDSGCAATMSQVSGENPKQNTGIVRVLNLIDDQWRTAMPATQPPQTCRNSAAADTYTTSWSLRQRPDGTLNGILTAVVITDDCGRKGKTYQVPISAVRIGDVAASVAAPDAALFIP